MKILVISDEESNYIWDHFEYENFKDIDLVISAGDLDPKYLSFIVTMLNVPLYYIHGNHDVKYDRNPPLGCVSIEDNIITYKGIRILGLGGSYQYKFGKHQYTEKDMEKRVKRLRKKLFATKGIDIVVSHAAPLSEWGLKDLPHKGFQVFRSIITQYKPSYFIHGHDHLNYSANAKRIMKIEDTTIINGYNYYMFDYEPNNISYKRRLFHLLPFFKVNHFK